MFCPNCGANVQGKFCAKCGTAVEAAAPSAGPASSSMGSGPAPGAQAYSTATPGAQPYTAAPVAQAGGMAENVAGALCYVLGLITGVLFLVLAPYNQNKFVRFHAFQAIFFHVAFIVLAIAETIIAMILPWYLTAPLGMLVWLAALVIWIVLLFKAYNNERFKLPIIGDLAEKQA